MQLASGCMWIWFANSMPTLEGFLWVLQDKNQSLSIFLVHSLWSHIVCTSLLGCRRFNHLCMRCGLKTQWVVSRTLPKPQIITIIFNLAVDWAYKIWLNGWNILIFMTSAVSPWMKACIWFVCLVNACVNSPELSTTMSSQLEFNIASCATGEW